MRKSPGLPKEIKSEWYRAVSVHIMLTKFSLCFDVTLRAVWTSTLLLELPDLISQHHFSLPPSVNIRRRRKWSERWLDLYLLWLVASVLVWRAVRTRGSFTPPQQTRALPNIKSQWNMCHWLMNNKIHHVCLVYARLQLNTKRCCFSYSAIAPDSEMGGQPVSNMEVIFFFSKLITLWKVLH